MHSPGFGPESAGLSGRSDDFGFRDSEAAADVAAALPPGTDLGGVTLVRLLAEGGMGRVYEAWQASPPRCVAVKVVRQQCPTLQSLARFEYEAAVLARLRHPQIAQIHTAGRFAGPLGAVPYLVMELIEDALPITHHAASRGLSIRQRVELVRGVCSAVAHAHGRGVLHRDLKPANVLVGADGVAKVIDFGVARPTGVEPDRELTLGGQLVGTLAYMSPEQLRGAPDANDAPSDVYALGLVLHEVVTGELPYDLRGLNPVAAAERLAGLRSGPAGLVEAAGRRDAGLSAAAARGLALVVGRCLEREPVRRYPSAESLAAELGRWLAGEPLDVQPPTAVESVLRAARRHPVAATMAVTTAVLGTLAMLAIVGFAIRAERERQRAALLAAESRARLGAADVLLAAEARDRGTVAEARRLLAESRTLRPVSGGAESIEVDCLAASLDESLGIVARHTAAVTAVAWSADGRTIATGDAAGRVHLSALDIRGGGPHTAAQAGAATAVCELLFEDAGGSAAVSGDATAVPPVDAGAPAPPDLELRPRRGTVWSLAFAARGGLVASGAEDGVLRIWTAAGGTPERSITVGRGGVYGVSFSPRGDLVACGSRDGTVRVYDVGTGTERLTLGGHVGTVFATAFAADGRTLATAGRDGTVRLWDPAGGGERAVLRGHSGRVFAVAFSPAGSRLASAAEDGSARLWDVDAARELTSLPHPVRVNGVAFLDDARIVTAAHDAVLRVWEADSGRLAAGLRAHASRLWAVAAAAGGRVVTGSEDATARAWDLAPDAGDAIGLGSRVKAVAVSGDGRLVAAGVSAGQVVLRDARSLAARGPLLETGSGVNGIAVSTTGSTVAAGCDDGSVHVWDLDTGAHRRLRDHARPVFSVSLSADGARLLSASEDRSARVTHVATGTAVGVLRHPNRVFCAAFAPGDAVVATACGDRAVRLWRADDGMLLHRLTGHTGQVNWVCFTADGTRLASAASDATVRLWRVTDGRELAVLAGPARQIWKGMFSPDSSRFAAAVADGDVHLWDVDTGLAVPALRGHRDAVWAVAFAADGRSLFSGGEDGTLRVWGVSRAELARRRATAE